MAIAASPDWSVATGFNSTNRKSLQPIPPLSHRHRNTTPHPFFSFIFLNLNVRAVRTNSSSYSSPLVLENEAPVDGNVPAVLQLGLKLQNFQPKDSLSNDSDELNALLLSLLKDSRTGDLAFDYYEKAKEKPDFVPQKSTLKLLIRYLTHSKNWDSIFSLCNDLQKFRVLPDATTCCKLITTCITNRKLKLADSLLEIFLVNDAGIAVLGFDSAMKGYNQLHMYSSTCLLYQRIKSTGLALNPACYSRIMEAYLKMKHYEKAVMIFHEFENKKFSTSSYHSQIYWILCESLGKMGRPYEALEYFREMPKQGISENHAFYSSFISSFASAGEANMAEELLKEAEGKNMLKDPALFLNLVLRYVEEGVMEKTLDVIDIMRRVNIRVSDCIFCAIVNGFLKKRGFRSAVKVFEDLVSQGCEPGQVTYASILNAYLRLGLYSKAQTTFSEMIEKGFDKCVVAYSNMIAAYGKMGRAKDAMRLVAKMKEKGCEPNVWTYNSLLDMHGRALNMRLVEKTWKEMKRRKIYPDRVSYTTVISAYNKAKDFEMCIKYYQEFKLNGGTVDRAMAGIMVAVFSKMNRIDELVEILQDMKMLGTKLDVRFYMSAMNVLRDAGLASQARWLKESFKYSSLIFQDRMERLI